MNIFGRAAEIERLRAEIAERDRQLAELGRRVDDLLDRETMHVYDPDMERLATAAAIERHGAARARKTPAPIGRPQLKALAGNVTELEFTAPHIERGVWDGFER